MVVALPAMYLPSVVPDGEVGCSMLRPRLQDGPQAFLSAFMSTARALGWLNRGTSVAARGDADWGRSVLVLLARDSSRDGADPHPVTYAAVVMPAVILAGVRAKRLAGVFRSYSQTNRLPARSRGLASVAADERADSSGES